MKAPSCKLCGKAHWGACLGERKVSATRAKSEYGGDMHKDPESLPAQGSVAPSQIQRALTAHQKRRSYARDYMRMVRNFGPKKDGKWPANWRQIQAWNQVQPEPQP